MYLYLKESNFRVVSLISSNGEGTDDGVTQTAQSCGLNKVWFQKQTLFKCDRECIRRESLLTGFFSNKLDIITSALWAQDELLSPRIL